MSFALVHETNTNEKAANRKTATTARPSNDSHGISSFATGPRDSSIRLRRAIGNQAVQRFMNSNKGFEFSKINIIQPKLKISQPEDIYEQEADRVAEKVMRMSVSDDSSMPTISTNEESVDRKCIACKMKEKEEEKEKMNVSRKLSSTVSNLEASDEITNEVVNIHSNSVGFSLDTDTKGFMESRFGYDFSNVRIHADERAARSANLVNALAYTVGNDIVFGEEHHKPSTLEGRRLLAHELTHIVQQNKGLKMMQRQINRELSERDRKEFVRDTIRFFNESSKSFELESVVINQARFDTLINNWYLMVEDRERIIDTHLAGDVLLKRELRNAYTGAIRVLISRAAHIFGKSEIDLYRENSGRIPLWAWQIPHHMEPGISTPIAEGHAADILTGEVNFAVNGIQVTVVPDTIDPRLRDRAETRHNFRWGNIPYRWERRGRQRIITSFNGPNVPSVRIQTFYPRQVTAESPSGYGRGTTSEDIAGGRVNPRSTSVGFHEGSHGLDFVEFLQNNQPPQFMGAVGMTENEFRNAMNQYDTNFRAYVQRMEEFSTRRTDCVGRVTIDQFNQANAAAGANIVMECPP
jgi:hypothetical protein